jgi:hypothetical protein
MGERQTFTEWTQRKRKGENGKEVRTWEKEETRTV